MRYAILFVLLAAILMPAHAADPPDVLHYMGVLRDSSDNPIDGTVAMVLRFYDDETGGNEILVDNHAGILVTTGLFNTALGTGAVTDGTGPGTYESLLDVFRDFDDVWLKIEVNGEALTPRLRVASAPYALNARSVRGHEVTTGGPLNLFVDAGIGSDANDGLSHGSAKATIQAALDLIPTILHDDVIVQVAAGTYVESLLLRDRLAPGGATITLQRDPLVFDAVVVSGNNVLSSTLEVRNVPSLTIEGFTFRDATSTSVRITEGNDVVLREVEVRDNFLGVLVIRSHLTVDDVHIRGNTTTGLFCSSSSRCRVSDLLSTGNFYGVISSRAAQVLFDGPVSISANQYGCAATEAGTLNFQSRSDVTVSPNNSPMEARLHGRILYYGPATVDGCTELTNGVCLP